jgi:sulfate/thiosulfate transport system substrate-binding protein
MLIARLLLTSIGCLVGLWGVSQTLAAPVRLLNVSYDPTRELFRDINDAFTKNWVEKHSNDLKASKPFRIYMSHSGSGKQSRSILEGLEADVATLALGYDLDKLVGPDSLLPANWREKLPYQSIPFTSTIVFAVRPGNPKQIRTWADLVRSDVQVITANPKTSGGARWVYLAAYGQILLQGGDSLAAETYVRALYRRVPVLDAAARGSMTTFAQRMMGDVCLTWENEARLTQKVLPGQIEIVTPEISIIAEPPVAVVEGYAKKHGTMDLARAYLTFMFSPAGQEIATKHGYRAQDSLVAHRYQADFPAFRSFRIDSLFGGWPKAHAKHFAEDGVFDRLQRTEKP